MGRLLMSGSEQTRGEGMLPKKVTDGNKCKMHGSEDQIIGEQQYRRK